MSEIILRNVTKTYDKSNTVISNLNLCIKDGSFTVLVGPSGCGKSTILRMIAGLETISSGELLINGSVINDVAPGDRDIAMVFQNYALYPTMTVRGNIEFGLINNKIPKPERERRISEISSIVGLTEYLNRKPAQLSGGQRQRVALARAMVKKPKVFLMDEPLSNLDAKLRAQMRTELIDLHKRLSTTFVYVTHDQTEAMSMATDIILLNQGEVQQIDTPNGIYNNPDNVFTAQFIDSPVMNIFDCEKILPYFGGIPEEAQKIGFRPSKVDIWKDGMDSENYMKISGVITACEMMGSEIIYRMNCPIGSITFKTFNEVELKMDSAIEIAVCRNHFYFFDVSGQRVRSREI